MTPAAHKVMLLGQIGVGKSSIAKALHTKGTPIELVGRGPISSQSVMWAALIAQERGDVEFASVTGLGCMREWADVFQDGMSANAVQPRAHLMGSLDNLRKQVRIGHWGF